MFEKNFSHIHTAVYIRQKKETQGNHQIKKEKKKNRYLCVAMYCKQRPQNIENGTIADYGVDALQCTVKEHTKIIENGPIISFTSFEQHVSMSVACKTSIFANELFITWGKRWSALSGSSC